MPGAPAELRRSQPDLPVHRQRGEPDVVAVEVVEDVGENEDRQQAPGDLREKTAFFRLVHRDTTFSRQLPIAVREVYTLASCGPATTRSGDVTCREFGARVFATSIRILKTSQVTRA